MMRQGSANRQRRAGFTLIELLVVIAIIGVLAGLILPGVQAARAAARRAECLNHLRNIGEGMANFASQKGYLPPAGSWDAADWPTAASPTNGYAEWTDLNTIGTSGAYMRYSWAFELLPFLERSDIYDQWDFNAIASPPPLNTGGGYGSFWVNSTAKRPIGGNLDLSNTGVKVFTCPADATVVPGRGNLTYVVNGGYSWHWRLDFNTTADGTGTVIDRSTVTNRRYSENLRNSGVYFTQTTRSWRNSFNPPAGFDDQREFRLESIKDGTTTTIMMAENINVGPGALWETTDLPSNWANPHPWNTSFFVNGGASAMNCVPTNYTGYDYSKGAVRGLQAPPITPTGVEGGLNGDLSGANEGNFPYPNSGHSGVVQVLMCDGAAKPISDNIDARTWARLVSPRGSAMVNPNTGVSNGVAQENNSGVGFTQNPVGEF